MPWFRLTNILEGNVRDFIHITERILSDLFVSDDLKLGIRNGLILHKVSFFFSFFSLELEHNAQRYS